jgi:hypothetical protein
MPSKNHMSDTPCRNFIRYLEVVRRIPWVKRESTKVYHQRKPVRLTSTFVLEEIQVSINGVEAKILAYQFLK